MRAETIEEEYQAVGTYDKERDWDIIKHKETGMLYLFKVLDRYDLNVYQCLKEIQNQHIVGIKEVYEKDHNLYIIEEYVQGKTLDLVLKDKSTLEQNEVISIALQLCEALCCIHYLTPAIIHRDIKLSNIILTQDQRIVLIDFNVSRLFKIENNLDTTFLGTNGYAAPEQFGFLQSDQRTDIYSFGVVINYLLTGLHPNEYLYEGNLGKVIRKCTSFDPNNRYNNVKTLMTDIKNAKTTYHEKKSKLKYLSTRHTIWPIPGFRTKKPWKMALAVFGYFFIIKEGLTYHGTSQNAVMKIIDPLAFTCMLLVLVGLYTNYLNITQRLNFFDSGKWYISLFGYCIYTVIIFIVFACLVGIASVIFV